MRGFFFVSAVVVFTKRADAEELIRTANEIPQSRGYFKWIGTDGWIEQLPEHHKNYLESLNGTFCMQSFVWKHHHDVEE